MADHPAPPDRNALSLSERQILDLVWRRGPISRGELSEHTGLTGATVTRAAQRLFDLDFISETVLREGQRGQPTRAIHVVPQAAMGVGVYFSHHELEIGLVDMAGMIRVSERHRISDATPAEIARVAEGFVTRQIAQGQCDPERLAGIGFALPGDFRGDPPVLNAHAFFPQLQQLDLEEEFASALPYPVFVENDAASAALGERSLGVGQTLDSFLFVHVGHGVGGGLVLAGRLWRGAHGNAGMIGVQFPNDQPRPSGQDLFAHLAAAGVAVDDFGDLEVLTPAACPPLALWLRRAGRQLREQLSITARLFDPQAVVIGGRLPAHVLHSLTAEIDQPGFCDEGKGFAKPRLVTSLLGPRSGVVGAACLPILHTYFRAAP